MLTHDTSDEEVKEKRELQKIPCMQCTDLFNSMAALKSHIELAHQAAANAPCNHCGKVFKTLRYCTEHEKICAHNPARQTFKCLYCSKTYSLKKLLNRHMKDSHSWGKKKSSK